MLATSSGSSALELSSLALNLKKNDEVVQSNSYWTAISHLLKIGVKIICCDIDKNLLIKKTFKSLINKKTKAIYIFHHGGMLVNSNSLRNELSSQENINR